MTPVEDLELLLTLGEDEHLEFKEAKRHFDFEELVKYVVALANERGGRMVLGVTDKLPRKVVGTIAFPDLGRIKADLSDRVHLRVDAEEISHPDGRIVVFHVPSRPIGMPIHYEGQFFMRSGERLVAMLPDMLKRILDEAGPDFSAETCPSATLDDLEVSAISDFRQRWVRKSGQKSLLNMTNSELLESAELLVQGAVTYAALVLFGSRTSLGRLLPQSEVIFEYRSSDSTGAAQAREDYRQGFFSFYDSLWEVINLRNDVQHFQDGLFILDIKTFNEQAVREALLNAISHRDYRLGGSIFVRQFPRRLEIVNPGAAPPGITFDNILWHQAPRNRRIAEALSRCGLVERSGQGMNTIYESCIRESKPEPDFRLSDDYHFGITLDGQIQHVEFLRVMEQIGQEQVGSFSTKDFLVVDLLYGGKPIPSHLLDALIHLADLGIVERSNQNRTQPFVLSRRLYKAVGEQGVYTRLKGLDRDTNKALLIKHIRENNDTGSKLEIIRQVLPALDAKSVQNLLTDLARTGIIHVKGKTKAGRWHIGPKPDQH